MSEQTQKKIHRASLLMMASIIVSRGIGFGREWILSQTVGASAQTDVYYASFTIPDFLNHLMAAGALSISFIPVLATFLDSKLEVGKQLFQTLSTVMSLVLIAFILVGELAAGTLATWIAPGFTGAQLETLTLLIRIILPAQLFFYWGGLAIAVQYSHGRFWFPALAPILYNVGIISFGLALNQSYGVMGFSVGVLVGSFVSHGCLQWWGVRRLGFPTHPAFHWTPEIKQAIRRYLWLSAPIMLGFSLVVADEWMAKFFGSYLKEGAISWLHYARREMRIPVDVIGQAAGIASFPFLARLWSQGQYELYGKTLLREIQKLWALAPLASIYLMDHALPVTHLIFSGGQFTETDYVNTARALQMYSLGIFFWSLQLILARGFYACQRTWLPSLLGTAISFLMLPAYYFLSQQLDYLGLALASSIGMGLYCVGLGILLMKHLKTHCPLPGLSHFIRFCGLWVGVLIVAKLASQGIFELGLYQGTRLSALWDSLVALLVIVAIGWTALRTYFKRFTDGKPLF